MDHADERCFDFFDRGQNVIYFSSAFLVSSPSIGVEMGRFLNGPEDLSVASLPNYSSRNVEFQVTLEGWQLIWKLTHGRSRKLAVSNAKAVAILFGVGLLLGSLSTSSGFAQPFVGNRWVHSSSRQRPRLGCSGDKQVPGRRRATGSQRQMG